LGSHLTGLSVLRLLAAHGIPAYAADGKQDMMARSRWYRPADRLLEETSDSDRLAEYLTGLPLERAVLMPCSDTWMRAVSGLPAELRERYPTGVPARTSVEALIDKEQFRELLACLDIPRPRGFLVNDEADLAAASDSEIEGGFLKPTDSQLFAARFGGKGFWARNRSQATRRFREARDAGVVLMLQDWIPGGASHIVQVDGFVDRSGDIAGLLARRRIRMEPPRLGNTSSSVSIPLADVAEPVAHTRRIIEAVQHRGVFSAEFKYDSRDGQYKILEINARPYWYIAHTAAAGLDLVWMWYLDALELPVPRMTSYRVGVAGLYEINDAIALKRSWSSHRRLDGPVMRTWLTGRRVMFWWRDPWPGLTEVAAAIRQRIVRNTRNQNPSASAHLDHRVDPRPAD
jgi:predicted ATP-grasp superfamily ATP-dependent carboligase